MKFLFNTSSLSSDAQETRQRDDFWRDSRGVVAKAWNDEDNIMQDLSALPELDLTDYLEKTEKYVGYSVGYKNKDCCF